ncbi:hypothetical protein AVEN_255881-1 [Araneus ventricosus]|uniref:Uncharacterized protein n=1 Tax=Araneus ventricosus TaxID=182803 RepID=A0A4Y2DDK0_ARAVE|nr:hypothetical protein AVEN_255881-1 [Araneus ventricosus]
MLIAIVCSLRFEILEPLTDIHLKNQQKRSRLPLMNALVDNFLYLILIASALDLINVICLPCVNVFVLLFSRIRSVQRENIVMEQIFDLKIGRFPRFRQLTNTYFECS